MINTYLENRWGGGPSNPSKGDLEAALAELSKPDPEHPSAWLVDDDEWIIDVYESGLVIFSRGESSEIARREKVCHEVSLELWLLLQKGKRDEIKKLLVGKLD